MENPKRVNPKIGQAFSALQKASPFLLPFSLLGTILGWLHASYNDIIDCAFQFGCYFPILEWLWCD